MQWSEGALASFCCIERLSDSECDECESEQTLQVALLLLNWAQIALFVFLDMPLVTWHKIPLLLGQLWMLTSLVMGLLIHIKRTVSN